MMWSPRRFGVCRPVVATARWPLEVGCMRLVETRDISTKGMDDHQTHNRNNGSMHETHSLARTNKNFVGGLLSTITESNMKNYFGQLGTITDVVMMYSHNMRRPRGFGFIMYDSEAPVNRVLVRTFHELNYKMFELDGRAFQLLLSGLQ
ncbi:RNA-binding (RRM/RBD/RNP motifs) family protein [Striga asiatica]|uniref:RNA-binding (RRM/RBD/RNP motifs) family protein n=1 Tax=Striga asiatica TaxID=4170 RepID=A0A5A7QA85_STRAF|nr:RNA-binding (RRM/RBD/RNP motifs) family protein [Striga asiatica]